MWIFIAFNAYVLTYIAQGLSLLQLWEISFFVSATYYHNNNTGSIVKW